ncbi:insulinase family protein [Pedobacter psychrodurus]|uniref:Insulinase family protein n=1 Tax=Pedobacter psychrodurus TaxID=2530456 RepID=A0A4R0PZ64_9SPHI|nr:M16 family metallopeptidase [Pedobacter psychrodurus]TCD28521.1 insulinase family protein [Pedobacter psychrodurus]
MFRISENKILRPLFLTLIHAAFGLSLFAQQKGQHQEKPLPLDPNVRTGTLPNGFTYFIRHNETPKNRAVLNLVVKAGSILEEDDQRGLAHFMEHMSFNGTKNFPKNELVNYLQKNGVRFGADINAYTGFDETVYQLPIPADEEILNNGIRILRDWADAATLDIGAINKERGVILEEKRLQTGVENRMQGRYSPSLFNHSRYAFREPIGTDSILRSFPREALERFYKDWYRPDLQAVVLVGDFDVDKIEKLVKNSFNGLKNPLLKKQRIQYHVGLTGKNQFLALTDPEMSSTVAQIIIKHKAEALSTASQYKNAIVRRLFNGMLAKRFRDLSRGGNQDFLQAGASIGKLLADVDNFSFSVVARPGQLDKGVSAAWKEVSYLKRSGFKQQELDMEKEIYSNAMENAIKEKNNISSDSYAKEYIAYFLNHDLAPGIETEYAFVKKFLAEINLKDLNQLIVDYIRNDNTDIIILAPENTVLPNQEKFRSWMDLKPDKSSVSENIAPFTPKDLLGKDPVAGKSISSTVDQESGTTTIILSNGIRVILKPTGFKKDEILFSGFSAGGTSLYPEKDYQSAKHAAAVVSSSGAGNYGIMEMDSFMANRQMAVRPFISELSQGISGGSTKGNIEQALRLAYAYITEPRVDTMVFKNLIDKGRLSIEGRSKAAEAVFQDSINTILGGQSFRRTAPSLAKLNQISMQRCLEIFRERFSNNAGMVFTFVGSFEIDSIKPLIEKYIGSLPVTSNKNRFRDNGIKLSENAVKLTLRKGMEQKAKVELVFSGNFDYTPENRIKMDAIRGILQIRMIERLREQESGVYSPSVNLSLDKNPTSTFKLSIVFDCDPKQYAKLIASALDEVRKLKDQGPEEVNVQKYIAESIRSRETSVSSNQWWLGYIAGQLEDSESLSQYSTYGDGLKKLTVKSIKEAAAAYLDENRLIEAVLLPEERK